MYIETEQPSSYRPWLHWSYAGGCVLVGALFLALLPTNLNTPAFSRPMIWALLFGLRAAIVLGVALWLGIARPWKSISVIEQHQGMITGSIAFMLFILVSLFMWLEPGLYQLPLLVLYYLNLVAILSQVVWLVRRGMIHIAASLLLTGLLLEVLATANLADELSQTMRPFLYVILILVAGLLVRWWAGLVLAGALPLLLGGVQLTETSLQAIQWNILAVFMLGLSIIAGLVPLYARALEKAIIQADLYTTELAAAHNMLQQQNQELQHQSNQLQSTQVQLQAMIHSQEERIADTTSALRQRSIELNSIQTPLIRVADGVLVIPLVGAWDIERVQQFTHQLLLGVEQVRAKLAILDFTGLTTATPIVAEMIQQIIMTTRLLGCQCELVGVRPEMAQELVNLDLDLTKVSAAADLAEGIATVYSEPVEDTLQRISCRWRECVVFKRQCW